MFKQSHLNVNVKKTLKWIVAWMVNEDSKDGGQWPTVWEKLVQRTGIPLTFFGTVNKMLLIRIGMGFLNWEMIRFVQDWEKVLSNVSSVVFGSVVTGKVWMQFGYCGWCGIVLTE